MRNHRDPYEISDGKHVMLMYEDEEHRAQAAAYWINRGLKMDKSVSMHLFMH